MPGSRSVREGGNLGQRSQSSAECGLLPPPVPQGPCLVLLVLRQKAGFVHRNLQGQRYYPPIPHPCTAERLPCSLLLDSLMLLPSHPVSLLAVTSYLPAFTEGETGSEKCHREVATEVGSGEPRLAP